MDPTVEAGLAKLEATEKAHLDLGSYMGNAYGGVLYPVDFLAFATLKRSMSVIAGFVHMIRSENFICAGALLRLQIDSLIRFYATFLVKEPHKFATDVLGGSEIRKLKDQDGKKMTDAYLVSRLTDEFPWLPMVYRETCGYIHLSHKHIFNVLKVDEGDSHNFSMLFGAADSLVTDEHRLEAIGAMISATEGLFEYVRGWAYTKDSPEVAKQ